MTDLTETAGVETLLAEQLRWLRAAAMPSVRETVEAALTTTKQRRAFELCDGSRTSTEIAKNTGVPKTTLSGWTKGWRQLGIANEVATDKGERIRHLVSLEALGLELKVD
jgi:hypothetical protein